MADFLKQTNIMDEFDKQLVSQAQSLVVSKGYIAWTEIFELSKRTHSSEATKIISDILKYLHHLEEASLGMI